MQVHAVHARRAGLAGHALDAGELEELLDVRLRRVHEQVDKLAVRRAHAVRVHDLVPSADLEDAAEEGLIRCEVAIPQQLLPAPVVLRCNFKSEPELGLGRPAEKEGCGAAVRPYHTSALLFPTHHRIPSFLCVAADVRAPAASSRKEPQKVEGRAENGAETGAPERDRVVRVGVSDSGRRCSGCGMWRACATTRPDRIEQMSLTCWMICWSFRFHIRMSTLSV